jgi:hypothetical protein
MQVRAGLLLNSLANMGGNSEIASYRIFTEISHPRIIITAVIINHMRT